VYCVIIRIIIIIIIIIIYLSWSWATCWLVPVSRIQKSLQRSAMIPSASWGKVFFYPGWSITRHSIYMLYPVSHYIPVICPKFIYSVSVRTLAIGPEILAVPVITCCAQDITRLALYTMCNTLACWPYYFCNGSATINFIGIVEPHMSLSVI